MLIMQVFSEFLLNDDVDFSDYFPGTDGDSFGVHEAGESGARWHQGKTAESAGGSAARRVPGTVWSVHQQNL